MYLKKTVYPIIAVFALLLGSVTLFAHAGMEHVMGTVAAVTDTSITVDTVKHTKVTVLLNPSTKFSHSNAQASLQDLKVGDRVVVEAKPNPDKKLVAAEVRWGAGSMKMDKMDDMDHKH